MEMRGLYNEFHSSRVPDPAGNCALRGDRKEQEKDRGRLKAMRPEEKKKVFFFSTHFFFLPSISGSRDCCVTSMFHDHSVSVDLCAIL